MSFRCNSDSNSENVDVSETKRGGKVYLYQSLCFYYRFLYSQVKDRYNEELFHDFWETNRTIWIKEYQYSKPMDVTHISDLQVPSDINLLVTFHFKS